MTRHDSDLRRTSECGTPAGRSANVSRRSGTLLRVAALLWVLPALPAAEFVRGDANVDLQIDVSDPVHILRNLFAAGAVPLRCRDAADVDDSSSVDLNDAMVLFNYLFQRGTPPRAPFPVCGADPSADGLDCADYPACNHPPVASFTATDGFGGVAGLFLLDASASSDAEGPIAAYAWDLGDGHAAAGRTITYAFERAGEYMIVLTVVDSAGSAASTSRVVTTAGVGELPGEGEIPSPGATVLHGRVVTLVGGDPVPVPAATVRVVVPATVLGSPPPRTATRADGTYDLAIGPGPIRLRFEKVGFVAAERFANAIAGTITALPDVVLTPLASCGSAVAFGAGAPPAIARGPAYSDARGTRTPTALIAPATGGTLVFPGGSARPVTSAQLCIQELQALPADLPALAGFAYTLELDAAEVRAANTTAIRFAPAALFVVENFLGFPVGTSVPAARFDRASSLWAPAPNGVVARVVGSSGGEALVDLDGDGNEESSAQLGSRGIGPSEREAIASLYPSGQTLWIVSLERTAVWALSWPTAPPSSAQPPPATSAPAHPLIEEACVVEHGLVPENGALRRAIAIAGTGLELCIDTSRSLGATGSRSVRIPLTGFPLPTGLARIVLEIQVAGRLHTEEIVAARDLVVSFTWNGQDVHGRTIAGSCPITTRVGYVYAGRYQKPAMEEQSFGLAPSGELSATVPTRNESVLWQEWRGWVGAPDPRTTGLGGWTLSVHHTYDPNTQMIHEGTGERRFAPAVGPPLLPFAGKGPTGDGNLYDGGPAVLGNLDRPWDVAVGPDGSVYIADLYHGRIRSVGADGIIRTFAGGGTSTAEGVPATDASLNQPAGLCVAPDGSVSIAEAAGSGGPGHKIRRVDAAGMISTVAGNGLQGFSGDGGDAKLAMMNQPRACAVGRDGTLYISDTQNNRIRRVDRNGVITTFAGTGTRAFSGDGGPAARAEIASPLGLCVAPDGSVYFVEQWSYRIRRVGLDGVISTRAGNGVTNHAGDGGLALLASMYPEDVDVAPDGSLVIADRGNDCIRRVGLDGVISTIAGVPRQPGFTADGAAATGSMLNGPPRAAVAADGSIYICDQYNSRIRRVPAPEATSELLVLSRDGTELHRFDATGRHRDTRDALTGKNLWTFAYDATGQLASLTDGDGGTTNIARGADGTARAVVSPGGLSTRLEVVPNGPLTAIIDPQDRKWRFVAFEDGLPQIIEDPDGLKESLTFDSDGRVTQWQDAGGRRLLLTRTGLTNGFAAEIASALGRKRSWRVEDRFDGVHKRFTTHPPGIITEYTGAADANRTVSLLFWDATSVSVAPLADPRWGAASTIESIGSAGFPPPFKLERSAQLDDAMDPTSLKLLTDRLTLGGKIWSFTFDAAARTVMLASPKGRTLQVALDARDDAVEWSIVGLHPIRAERDALGRLTHLSQGPAGDERVFDFQYDTWGLLSGDCDPATRQTGIVTDAAGLVMGLKLPGDRDVAFSRYADGSLASLTPPGRPAHHFERDRSGLPLSYSPPRVASGETDTRFEHDADGELARILRPDGGQAVFTRDAAGRVTSVDFSHGKLLYAFEPSQAWLSRVTGPGGVVVDRTRSGSLLDAETWSGPTAGKVSRTYTSLVSLASLRVNNSTAADSSIAFTRDDDGLVTAAGPLVLTLDSQNGLVTSRTLGPLTEEIAHDGFGEIPSRTLRLGGAQIYRALVEHDRLGRVQKVLETIGTTTRAVEVAYDAAGNVASFKVDGALVASCSYDLNQNRIAATGPTGTLFTALFDAQDRIRSQGGATFEHNAAGERTKRSAGASVTEYEHDSLGNLRATRLPDGRRVERLLDGFGRVVGRAVDGAIIHRWLYRDAERPVATVDVSGAVTALFIHTGEARLPDAILQGGATYLVVPDPWGSPRLVVNAGTGEITQRIAHDPWGAVVEDSNPGFQPFGFLGGLRDPATGLVRIDGRDFESDTARCLARDPRLFDGGGTNLYALSSDAGATSQLFFDGVAPHRGLIHDRCGRTVGAGAMSLFVPRALELPGPHFAELRAWVEAAMQRPVALPPVIRLNANGLSRLGGRPTRR